ncbi:MAG: hypothetical protein WA005_01970 [Candidatus Binataceae bacterium]
MPFDIFALRGGCDVLPVHIKGPHEVLGKGKLIRATIRWRCESGAGSAPPRRSEFI